MASEPIREQLITKVKDRLAAITAGATFWFTPGDVVRDWKNYDEAEELAKDRPVYGVIEGVERRPASTYTQIKAVLTVIIIGWVMDEENRRIAMNRAIADVIRALYQDEEWNGLALVTRVTEIATDEAAVVAKPHAYFELTAEIEYMVARTGA